MKSKSEEKCRAIMQRLLKVYLSSSHPSWLINPETDSQLELDGYNAWFKTPIGKGLAFEYDGRQHTEFVPNMHRTILDFEKQVRRDRAKDYICLSRQVLLIRIPHVERRSDERLEADIKVILRNHNLLLG